MQTIFKSTENQQQVPATSIANDSNNMLTTNYHFRDTPYRVKIKLEYGLYIHAEVQNACFVFQNILA